MNTCFDQGKKAKIVNCDWCIRSSLALILGNFGIAGWKNL
jgi:hypothetical protein